MNRKNLTTRNNAQFIGVIVLIIYVLVAVLIGSQVYMNTQERSDVIIVLGAKSHVGTRVNQCLKARVDHAVELYQQGLAPKILMSGGNDEDSVFNQAETMREIALNQGVNDQDIILEKKSTSTYENLLFAKQMMKSNDFKSAVVVTEPYHEPRAGLVAKHLGMNYTLSPALHSSCWAQWKWLSYDFLREPVALIYYFLRGRI